MKLVIACENYDLALKIANKFLIELDEAVQISVITQYSRLKLMSDNVGRNTILLLGREFYYQDLKIENYSVIVLLDPEEKTITKYSNSFIAINPFHRIDVLYGHIINVPKIKNILIDKAFSGTKLILLCSACGGSGRTTISYGLSMAFARNYKKAIYINPSYLQDFDYMFENKSYLPQKLEWMISKRNDGLAEQLISSVVQEGFDYLPPMRMSFITLGIHMEDYMYMIRELKNAALYDYIVVDMPAGIIEESVLMIGAADRIIYVGSNDKDNLNRMDRYLKSIDMDEIDKYIFVCNRETDAAKGSMKNKLFNMNEKIKVISVEDCGCVTDIRDVYHEARYTFEQLAVLFLEVYKHMNREYIEFYPVGTVVIVKGNVKKICIIARGVMAKVEGEVKYFDYAAVLFPEGLVSQALIYFNHEDIVKVVHNGYSDEDEKLMRDNVNEWMKKTTIKRGNAYEINVKRMLDSIENRNGES